jgi:hypothetical protein
MQTNILPIHYVCTRVHAQKEWPFSKSSAKRYTGKRIPDAGTGYNSDQLGEVIEKQQAQEI